MISLSILTTLGINPSESWLVWVYLLLILNYSNHSWYTLNIINHSGFLSQSWLVQIDPCKCFNTNTFHVWLQIEIWITFWESINSIQYNLWTYEILSLRSKSMKRCILWGIVEIVFKDLSLACSLPYFFFLSSVFTFFNFNNIFSSVDLLYISPSWEMTVGHWVDFWIEFITLLGN